MMYLILVLSAVVLCSGCFYYDDDGYPQPTSNYKLNVTVTGYACRRWDGSIAIGDLGYNLGSEDENYCRNPDQHNSLWCYSTNPAELWENCEAKGCGCYFIDELGNPKSTGTLSVTETGYQCMRWDDTYSVNDLGYDLGSVHENYCRNPDQHNSLWCYSSDPSESWENCDPAGCATTTAHEDLTTAHTSIRATSKLATTTSNSNKETTVKHRTSTETEKTTIATNGEKQYLCPCNDNSPWISYFYGNLTQEEKTEIIEKEKERIKRELTVEKTEISSYIMKKKCANDKRASAQSIGNIGVGILVTVVITIVLSDLINCKCIKNNKNSKSGKLP